MEDNHDDQPKNPPAPTHGGVMDVQAPQHVDTAPELDSPTGFDDAPAPAKTPITPDALKDEPSHADEPTPAPAEDHGIPSKPAIDPAALHKDEVHPLLAAHAQRRPVPFIAVIIAIVVAVGLAGLAVYIYQNSKESTHPEDDQTSQTEQTAPATAADVDNTSKEVDSTISSVDDTSDLPETDLTDQTLGL